MIESLPIQLAARLALDSISYSNPLPPWSDSVMQNYGEREGAIRQRISKYLTGEAPLAPFKVAVPKKDGEKKVWKIPSVNDQIIIQVCVSAIADKIQRALDYRHTWSYRFNTNPDHIQLTESQVSLWKQFQDETDRRCRDRAGCLLQIDLENAFQSIDREKFFAFLEDVAPGNIAVSLLRHLLPYFSAEDEGLPLINDSVFFMGNAYLYKVDQIVAKHTSNFIRFVDDYRIFGGATDLLESVLNDIDKDLASLGFKIKKSKVKLGSAEEYLDAVSNGKYAETKIVDGYISAVALEDVTAPDLLLKLITRAIESPDDLLTEGFGRLSLGAIRRIRLNHAVVETKNYPGSPLGEYQNMLSTNESVIQRALGLLENYIKSPDENWRSVWLINLMQDVSGEARAKVNEMLQFISTNSGSELVRLCTRKALAGLEPTLTSKDVEDCHDLDYLGWGRRLWAE